MPYTPPASQSPASSKSTSPAVSRSSSYHEDLPPRSPVTNRPQPPRSASYLHKHRRSPSVSTSAPPTPVEPASEMTPADNADFVALGSLRQSPPPVNNLRIPTGAVISPPDSSENSDADEHMRVERGRELEKNWHQLRQAVRAIPQQRENSPDKRGNTSNKVVFELGGNDLPAHEPVSQITSSSALSAEARKISHSRSSTETAIMIPSTAYLQSPIQTSDSEEDESHFTKPSLVRKKSGELVKPALRASSRRRYSSMPGTPTYHKSVHFNDNDNQTRHFLQVDKPIAVSAGTSPVEVYESESEFPFEGDGQAKPELMIKISNFPADSFERSTQAIRVERIFLSADKNSLIGTCAVQNLAFHKHVAARFTLDYWKTTSEVVAEYNHDPRSPATDGCDRFNFVIKLTDQANIASKTLLLCVRYTVGDKTYWDNNENRNYQIDFSKSVPTANPSKPSRPVQSFGLGQRPIAAIPRSRHSPSRHHVRPVSVDDDFAARIDSGYSFGSADSIFGGESPSASIKLKPKPKRQPIFNMGLTAQAPANGLGSRYDFGTSLSAALTSAQNTLGRQSGLMNAGPGSPANQASNPGYFGIIDRSEPPQVAPQPERPDALTTDRPAMGSDQYRDLVQKFCYFTPATSKAGPASSNAAANVPPPPSTVANPAAVEQPSTAASVDPSEHDSDDSSPSSSGSNSPMLDGSSERRNPYDGTNERSSPFAGRSASPATSSRGMNTRSTSPGRFGYPYHSAARDGYLSDTPSQTAIHG